MTGLKSDFFQLFCKSLGTVFLTQNHSRLSFRWGSRIFLRSLLTIFFRVAKMVQNCPKWPNMAKKGQQKKSEKMSKNIFLRSAAWGRRPWNLPAGFLACQPRPLGQETGFCWTLVSLESEFFCTLDLPGCFLASEFCGGDSGGSFWTPAFSRAVVVFVGVDCDSLISNYIFSSP